MLYVFNHYPEYNLPLDFNEVVMIKNKAKNKSVINIQVIVERKAKMFISEITFFQKFI